MRHPTLIRTFMSTMQKKTHLDITKAIIRKNVTADAEVRQVLNISPTVKELTLYVKNPELSFKAGNWVDFFIPNVYQVGGYSIISSPQLLNEKRLLQLAVKRSNSIPAVWIHERCKGGDAVQIRVGGNFYFDHKEKEEVKSLILVAGGVGINPLQSIMEYCLDAEDINLNRIVLHQSAQRVEELLFTNRHQEMKNKIPLETHYYITKEPNKTTRMTYRDLESSLANSRHEETAIYLCGPRGMTDTVESWAKQAGLPAASLHLEKWW